MNCQDFRCQLGRFAYDPRIPDGFAIKLSPSELAAMDDHARHCAACGPLAASSRLVDCREVVDVLADYLDGRLPSEARAAFELHLSVCPACIAYIESYKQTVAMEKRAFDGPSDVPQSIPEDLVRAVLAARKNQPPK